MLDYVVSSSTAETWKNELMLYLVEHNSYGISCIIEYQFSPKVSDDFKIHSIINETSFDLFLLRAF